MEEIGGFIAEQSLSILAVPILAALFLNNMCYTQHFICNACESFAHLIQMYLRLVRIG